jgi:hypothetical protein
MSSPTATRPAPSFAPAGPPQQGPAKIPAPAGAAKMQAWHVDRKTGRHVDTASPVPVDADNYRTDHRRHVCTKPIEGGGKPGEKFRPCPTEAWLLPGEKRYCPVHGREPLKAPSEPGQMWLLAKEARRVYGRAAAPWLLLTVNTAAAVSAQAADLPALDAVPLIPAAAATAYLITKKRLTGIEVKAIIREQKVTAKDAAKVLKTQKRVMRRIRSSANAAAAAGALSAGWMVAASATDPSTWPGRVAWGAMLATWAVGSYPWWKRAENLRTRAEPTTVIGPPPEQVHLPKPVDPLEATAGATWKKIIGCASGPLAGTHLTNFRRLPACPVGGPDRARRWNWTAEVHADAEGSINMREERANLLGRIAAAFDCSYGDVSFAADPHRLGRATLRIQPDNHLAEARTWQGPTVGVNWQKGFSQPGRYEDGAPVRYQWWSDTGAVHDLITGTSGAGKSEFVTGLILTSLHSDGRIIDWVGDPQRGQSFGALKRYVDWFAGSETEIVFMLLAAVAEMYRRNTVLSQGDVKAWRPTRDMPLLVITLDEVQKYINTNPIAEKLVTHLAGQARKCGIKLRLITQIGAAYSLGNDTYIKEQLVGNGQSFAFRAGTEVAARSAKTAKTTFDPSQLPEQWGPLTCAPGETTAGLMYVGGRYGRDIYARTDHTGDDLKVWLYDEHSNLTTSPGAFSAEAQANSGVLWGDRAARAEAELAAGLSLDDLLPNGAAHELVAAAAAATKPVDATKPADVVVPLHAVPTTPPATAVVLAAARQVADINGVFDRQALTAAVAGRVTDAILTNTLADLIATGEVVKPRQGIYVLTAAPTAASA